MNQDGVLEMELPNNSVQLIMETRTRTKHVGSARRCQGYLSAFSAGKEFLLFWLTKEIISNNLLLFFPTLDGCNTTCVPVDDATGYIIVSVSPAVFFFYLEFHH